MNIEEQIAQLKARAESATAAKYRAEAAKHSAQQRYDEAMQLLAEQFGLDNLKDARAKLEQLETTLQNKVAEATEILDAMKL